MKSSTTILAASVLASYVVASETTVFAPIPDITLNTTLLENIALAHNVTMLYGNNDTSDSSLVNVTLSMNLPTVILENIGAISSVDCSDDSVTVIFNNTASYDASVEDWFDDGNFVMVTNHMGDCDAEVERGFFLVEELTWDNTTLSVTASASRTNISSTAGTADVLFGGIPATVSRKRSTTLDPSYTASLDLALPVEEVLYTLTDYLEVIADEVSLDTTVTYSGYLKYDFWTFSLQDLYFDIDVDSTLDIAITAEVLAAYSTTFTYAPATLSASVVSVAGILTIGPALTFVASADLSAGAPVNLSVSTTVSLTDATIHLDLLDEDNTSTSNWVPTYGVTAEISGEVEASLNPSASLTVEIQIEFLSGLIDLSSGLTLTPGFTNTFTVAADEVVSYENGTVTATSVSEASSCSNGVEVASDFTFDLVGFVTAYFSTTLYSTTVPVADECWTWSS